MRTERVLVMLFVISVCMRLFHIQGADMIMIVALGGLTIMYGIFGFYFFSSREVRSQTLLVSIISGILLALAPIGILFRLLYWHDAKQQVMFGAMFSLIALLVVLMLRFTSTSTKLRAYYRNMIIRCLVLFIFTTALFFVRRSTLIKMEYWDDPKMAEKKIEYYRNRGR